MLCPCPLCRMTAAPKRDFIYDMQDQNLNMPVSINIPKCGETDTQKPYRKDSIFN